jgi:putative ABC transport system permease protein
VRSLAILKIAFWALGRNKMRSALTMLGIIIGVGAVIALVSIGQGAQELIREQMAAMGTNVMYVWPQDTRRSGGARGSSSDQGSLSVDDVFAIRNEVPVIAAATPIVNSDGQIIYKNNNMRAQVQGVSEEFPTVRDWKLTSGSFFTSVDIQSRARVLVIGQAIVDELFEGLDPVGETVRLRNQPFEIIGVLESKGQTGVGQNQDEAVLAPYTTVQRKLLGQTLPRVNQVMLKTVDSEGAFALANRMIDVLLRERHKIPPDQEEPDFSVGNLTEIADAAEQQTVVMTLMLGSIAAIALVVGGIGIMNIMLVSVTERTREIGIRMAVGSRPGYVRLQFLAESIMMSLTGGAVGVIFGGGCSVLIGQFLGWNTFVSPASIMISFGFAAAVGVFFGFYPAHKAAKLDPIDALRYE